MNRRGLTLPPAKYHWLVVIFMVACALDHVLMTKGIGTYYKAVHISKVEQSQDSLGFQNLHPYFHECSMTSKCNYVVEDKKNTVKLYNYRSDIPGEEELLGIWMKEPPFANHTDNGEYEYTIFMERLSWQNAREQCHLHGGELASVTSKEEEDKIKEQMSNSTSNGLFWLGLNDVKEEGKYVWSDGSEKTYVNWGIGEPQGLDGENCILATQFMAWADYPCNREAYFICKNSV